MIFSFSFHQIRTYLNCVLLSLDLCVSTVFSLHAKLVWADHIIGSEDDPVREHEERSEEDESVLDVMIEGLIIATLP